MMAKDPDALICDMAETYHIYDMGAVPLRTLATLALGLGTESRTMRSLTGAKVTRTEMLLATIADGINTLVWFKTKDGRKGKNRPKRMLDCLIGSQREAHTVGFDTAEEFEKARKRIMKEVV